MSRSIEDPIFVVGFGISSFANRVLIGHPCTVLRRYAQVHEYARTAHLLPFNLVSVVSSLKKMYTSIVMTSFIVSSFVETVQPDTNVFDVVVKGFDRLKFDLIGSRDSTKRFSVFYLVAPTVALLTAHFLVYKFIYDTVYGIRR
ncbi:solute carrier family 25 member 46 [Ditylenchus destructor]|nr:solute carrier family 25 member 46 [Ditylenchus destructor]